MKKLLPYYLFALLMMSSFSAFSQAVVSPWQIHEGKEGIVKFKSTSTEERKAAFGKAQIPPKNDAGWKLAETKPDGTINFSRSSVLKQCQGELDFTYFQASVNVPANVDVTSFTLSYDLADDGARIYFFNSKFPNGKFDESSDLIGNQGNQKTVNLKDLIVKGEENRIVIVQYDNCPVLNRIVGIRLKLNQQEIKQATAPVAANENGVTLFEHVNFGGKSRSYGPGVHEISSTDMNDITSSVKVPNGWKVTVYEHWKTTGQSVILTEDTKDLAKLKFNDKISSIKVEKTGTAAPASTTTAQSLPDQFKLHAYSIHGKRQETGSDYWMGFNPNEAGTNKSGKILNQQNGTVMIIEKTVIDASKGIIALKVTNAPSANMYLTVDGNRNVIVAPATAGSNRHHFKVQAPEEKGAASLKYISFESVSSPGWFIRHEGFALKVTQATAQVRNDIVYRQDATWLFEAARK